MRSLYTFLYAFISNKRKHKGKHNGHFFVYYEFSYIISVEILYKGESIVYNYDVGQSIGSLSINSSLCSSDRGYSISNNSGIINHKERLKEMSIVKIAYKSGIVVVGADRRINLVSDTCNAFQTTHIKAKYIAKYNSIISAVGLLKHNNIWWDDYCSPIIERCNDLNSFLEGITEQLNKDSYDLELQITDYNNGAPIAYAYDISKKKIINRSYDEMNNYYNDRLFHYGLITLGEYISLKTPPVFFDNNYLENYIKYFIANVIELDEHATKELSLFQSTKTALVGYPIDIIVIDKDGSRTTTLESPHDL